MRAGDTAAGGGPPSSASRGPAGARGPGRTRGGSTGGGHPNSSPRTATSPAEGKGRTGPLGRRGRESPVWTLG